MHPGSGNMRLHAHALAATAGLAAAAILAMALHRRRCQLAVPEPPPARTSVPESPEDPAEVPVPPSWKSLVLSDDGDEECNDWLFYDDDEDEDKDKDDEVDSQCAELEFVNALERRIVELRWPKTSRPSHGDNGIVNDIESDGKQALTVWEYRDLFEPRKEVDMEMYEEFVRFMRLTSPASSEQDIVGCYKHKS